MACSRCEARRKAIAAGLTAAASGNIKAAATSAAFVTRTLAQDARNGTLRTAATAQLAQMRAAIRRR